MDDIYVYVVDLPDKINEMVTPCEGGYTVYINKKLSEYKALRAFHHAVGHVVYNDWEKSAVQTIEREAHEREENKDSLPLSAIQFRIPD